MLKIAITGNIASGKTTVQKILEQKSYKVLDTDIVGHKLLDELPEIKNEFSKYEIFNTDGKINRPELGKLVFSNPELKAKLEEIIHPAIKSEILKFFDYNADEKVVFVGIPLLFETNMRDIFDKAVLIYTNDNIRKERLIKRNLYTAEYAQCRMDSQMSQDNKKALCEYIIDNNGNLDNLSKEVQSFLNNLSV